MFIHYKLLDQWVIKQKDNLSNKLIHGVKQKYVRLFWAEVNQTEIMQPISCNTQEDKCMEFILHMFSPACVKEVSTLYNTHSEIIVYTEPPTSIYCVCTVKWLWLEQIASILVNNYISTARVAVWLWSITEVPLCFSALQIRVGFIVMHGRSQFTSIHIDQIFQNRKLNVHSIWQI